MSLRNAIAAAILSLAAAGCTSMAPTYQSPVANIDAAAKLQAGIDVGKFEFRKGEESSLNSVQARAASFTSPVNGSYADYFAEAVRADLRGAGKLDASSPKVLTGTIEKNDLSAGGVNTNDAEISVRFRLAQGDRAAYDKALTAKHQWESSFLGGIAIPRAIQNYVVTLQKLLHQLYSDPEFAAATRR
jgi:hypothetical protein